MKTGSEEWNRVIREGAKSFGITADELHLRQFGIHAAELVHWNQKINLTAITDPLEIAVKHFIDSMAPVSVISPGSRLLDIGSGGGFPGLPIKIMLPSVNVTLIDSSKKKVSFLNHVIRQLALPGIDARHIRAEDLAKEKKSAFDVIISRALSDLKTFVSLASPLLSDNGMIVAVKGELQQSETDHAIAFLDHSDRFCPNGIKNYHIRSEPYQLPILHQKGTVFAVITDATRQSG